MITEVMKVEEKGRVLRLITDCCFGIYKIHVFVLDNVKVFFLNFNLPNWGGFLYLLRKYSNGSFQC